MLVSTTYVLTETLSVLCERARGLSWAQAVPSTAGAAAGAASAGAASAGAAACTGAGALSTVPSMGLNLSPTLEVIARLTMSRYALA